MGTLIILGIIAFLAWYFLFSTTAKLKKILRERDKEVRNALNMTGINTKNAGTVKPSIIDQKLLEEFNSNLFNGYINDQLICPHCQTKGKVRSKRFEREIVTRKNVGLGFALGGKDVTKRMANTFKCDNCGTSWEV